MNFKFVILYLAQTVGPLLIFGAKKNRKCDYKKILKTKVNLLNYLNKIIMLLCYMYIFCDNFVTNIYGKNKNILHIVRMGIKNCIYLG